MVPLEKPLVPMVMPMVPVVPLGNPEQSPCHLFLPLSSFQGNSIHTHRGERTGEDIIEFVNKARG